MRYPVLLLVAVLSVSVGCDRFDEGIRAYESDRFEDAWSAFASTEASHGTSASAAVLQNRALAALRIGRLRDAEFSAEKAVARGGPELASFRDFVFGNAEFLRCLRAEAEAGLEDADPTALARAIRHGEGARDAWMLAVERRTDWPAARRNIERVEARLAELRRRKAEEDQRRRTERAPRPPEPTPSPEEEPSGEDSRERLVPPDADPDVLGQAELQRLLQRLAEKDAEKRAVRAETRAAESARVERDW